MVSKAATMIPVSADKLLAEFHGKPPASIAALARGGEHLRFPLPDDYARLLQQMNGGEGFIGKNYLQLWSVQDFMAQNTGTYYAEAAPGLLRFGSNGGGEAFAFDIRSMPPSIVMVPFIGMELEVTIPIASSFDSFL